MYSKKLIINSVENKLINISVIIPTFLRPIRIFKTLKAIIDQDLAPNQVIVINQTPNLHLDPEIKKIYNKRHVELTWINRKKPSLCGARNDGIKECTNKIAIFLDDDILIPNGLFNEHLQMHLSNLDYIAFGGQVYHRLPNMAIDDLIIEKKTYGTSLGYKECYLEEFGPLFGGHFSINTEIAKLIGGWDELFIGSANWEEGDLMNRLKSAGYKFAYSSNLWLIHLREPGGCRISGNISFPEWTKSYNFLLYKFRYPLDKTWSETLKLALRAGPLRKEIVKNPTKWLYAWFSFLKGIKIAKQNSAKTKLYDLNTLQND